MKLTRRVFNLLVSLGAVMPTTAFAQEKMIVMDHPAIKYLEECCERNIQADFEHLRALNLSEIEKLPVNFWTDYYEFLANYHGGYDNWEKYKKESSYSDRYTHLLNAIREAWKSEGYPEWNEVD